MKTARIELKVRPELKEKIVKQAEKEDVSLNKIMETFAKEGLAKREAKEWANS